MPMTKAQNAQAGRRILQDLMSVPTAPFAEHEIVDFIKRFCTRRAGVTLSADAFGNLLIRVRRGGRRVARPVCITAHMDHPGFVADRMTTPTTLRAHWRGGVPPDYFVGSRVRFRVDGAWIKGTVRLIKTSVHNKRKRVDTALIDVARTVPPGSLGMWALPAPKVRGNRIHAPACDDLAGAAAMLACIDRLSRSRKGCDAYFLLTRAEEVGFAGAILAARHGTIPSKCIVIAMETSSELPHARMGDGPILRVGDRITTFTSAVTAYGRAVADDLQKSDKRFTYQRRLMDGGACESTAYCALGYEATGICVALGNYHNADTKRVRIAPEYIDLRDYDKVVEWFVALATTTRRYTGRDEALMTQLKDLERTHRALLRSTVSKPA